MPCKTILVPSAELSISEIGFGTITGRFDSCSVSKDVVGSGIYVWFNVGGEGLSRIRVTVSYDAPDGHKSWYKDYFPYPYSQAMFTTDTYEAGTYTNLKVTAVKI